MRKLLWLLSCLVLLLSTCSAFYKESITHLAAEVSSLTGDPSRAIDGIKSWKWTEIDGTEDEYIQLYFSDKYNIEDIIVWSKLQQKDYMVTISRNDSAQAGSDTVINEVVPYVCPAYMFDIMEPVTANTVRLNHQIAEPMNVDEIDVFAEVDGQFFENLALYAKTTQSSTDGDHTSDLAVNGILTDYSSTAGGIGQEWKVNLQLEYLISSIILEFLPGYYYSVTISCLGDLGAVRQQFIYIGTLRRVRLLDLFVSCSSVQVTTRDANPIRLVEVRVYGHTGKNSPIQTVAVAGSSSNFCSYSFPSPSLTTIPSEASVFRAVKQPVFRYDSFTAEDIGSLSKDYMYMSMTTTILPLFSGSYYFEAKFDDSVVLFVGQEKLLNYWSCGSRQTRSQSITLQAGKVYPLRLYYQNKDGSTLVNLYWEGPNFEKRSFGSDILTHTLDSLLKLPPPTFTVRDQGCRGYVDQRPRLEMFLVEGNVYAPTKFLCESSETGTSNAITFEDSYQYRPIPANTGVAPKWNCIFNQPEDSATALAATAQVRMYINHADFGANHVVAQIPSGKYPASTGGVTITLETDSFVKTLPNEPRNYFDVMIDFNFTVSNTYIFERFDYHFVCNGVPAVLIDDTIEPQRYQCSIYRPFVAGILRSELISFQVSLTGLHGCENSNIMTVLAVQTVKTYGLLQTPGLIMNNCNDRGVVIGSVCVCNTGYSGSFCEIASSDVMVKELVLSDDGGRFAIIPKMSPLSATILSYYQGKLLYLNESVLTILDGGAVVTSVQMSSLNDIIDLVVTESGTLLALTNTFPYMWVNPMFYDDKQWKSIEIPLENPVSIAADPISNRVYVIHGDFLETITYSMSNMFDTSFKIDLRETEPTYSDPRSVAVSSSGLILVHFGDSKILQITQDSAWLSPISSVVDDLEKVAIDNFNNVYLITKSAIHRYYTDGTKRSVVGKAAPTEVTIHLQPGDTTDPVLDGTWSDVELSDVSSVFVNPSKSGEFYVIHKSTPSEFDILHAKELACEQTTKSEASITHLEPPIIFFSRSSFAVIATLEFQYFPLIEFTVAISEFTTMAEALTNTPMSDTCIFRSGDNSQLLVETQTAAADSCIRQFVHLLPYRECITPNGAMEYQGNVIVQSKRRFRLADIYHPVTTTAEWVFPFVVTQPEIVWMSNAEVMQIVPPMELKVLFLRALYDHDHNTIVTFSVLKNEGEMLQVTQLEDLQSIPTILPHEGLTRVMELNPLITHIEVTLPSSAGSSSIDSTYRIAFSISGRSSFDDSFEFSVKRSNSEVQQITTTVQSQLSLTDQKPHYVVGDQMQWRISIDSTSGSVSDVIIDRMYFCTATIAPESDSLEACASRESTITIFDQSKGINHTTSAVTRISEHEFEFSVTLEASLLTSKSLIYRAWISLTNIDYDAPSIPATRNIGRVYGDRSKPSANKLLTSSMFRVIV